MDGLPGELRKGPVGTDLIVCVFFFHVVSSVACLNDGIGYKYPGDHNLWVRDFFFSICPSVMNGMKRLLLKPGSAAGKKPL